MLTPELLAKLCRTQLRENNLPPTEVENFKAFLTLMAEDHFFRRQLQLRQYSIFFNLVDKTMQPYVPQYLSHVYADALNTDLKEVIQLEIASPGKGKTTEINQGDEVMDQSMGDSSDQELIEFLLTEIETFARTTYDIPLKFPRPTRKARSFHVSFDRARLAVLAKRNPNDGPLKENEWVKVNTHILTQVEAILATPSDDLKVLKLDIPGVFDENRGKSVAYYLIQQGYKVYANAIFSDPRILEISLALRDFVLKTRKDLYKKVKKKFNTELVGFGTKPEDDAQIIEYFQGMCPPALIKHIDHWNLFGAKRMREREDYQEFEKNNELLELIPLLQLLPEADQEELRLLITTTYWYLINMLKIPEENVNLIYNRLVEGRIEYNIRS